MVAALSRARMGAWTVLAALLVLCEFAPTTSWAKAPGDSALVFGDRVRVTYPQNQWSVKFTGQLLQLTADSLAVTGSHGLTMTWPWPGVTQLERSVGRKSNAGEGALVGGAIGVVLIVGAVVASETEEGIWAETGPADALFVGGIAAAITTGLGALIGHLVRSDRWQVVPLEQARPDSSITVSADK